MHGDDVDVSPEDKIDDVDVSVEMRESFLEYAYSVIYARALPDARDGLKPVQRRILYQMQKMGLNITHGHVKSQRVVGEVMGKLHPHGDAPIYDALVRLSQDFNLRLPLVDGHGNFGSLDDGPAAARYTEARLAAAADLLTEGLNEDAVDFVPNYDNQFMQPDVLPAQFPSLLVNGASGIAVGMATSIAPHNPAETIRAALHLLRHPDASLEDLMRFIPGPDFPGGGIIPGLDGVRDAYATGRGTFKLRAKTSIERITARKTGIVVTELPYMVGPERVIERIKDGVNNGKIKGISAVTNLTDRHHGLRLVIDVKSGFDAKSVLQLLYRHTPLEETFAFNGVALVDGQPQTMPLASMLQVFVDHRIDVTLRRTKYLVDRKEERLHLVLGLLRAVLDIDDVIAIIRSSDDSGAAKERLMLAFELSEVQAQHILDLRLKRLTRFSTIELETEQAELESDLRKLKELLASRELLEQKVADDLTEVARKLSSPRRTILLDDAGEETAAKASSTETLEIADEPCIVVLTAFGALARIAGSDAPEPPSADGDLWLSWVPARTRGAVAAVTADGFAHRVEVETLPALARSDHSQSYAGAVPAKDLLETESPVAGLAGGSEETLLTIGTKKGVVKRVKAEPNPNRDSWPVITLDEGDEIKGISNSEETDFAVFVTRNAQLLKFPVSLVRPQGLPAGGMQGIKLASDDEVIFFAAVTETPSAAVLTIAQRAGNLPGTFPGTAKISALMDFPAKGRATMGVRCHRFLRGEDELQLAWAGPHEPVGTTSAGTRVLLPKPGAKRDASGESLASVVEYVG